MGIFKIEDGAADINPGVRGSLKIPSADLLDQWNKMRAEGMQENKRRFGCFDGESVKLAVEVQGPAIGMDKNDHFQLARPAYKTPQPGALLLIQQVDSLSVCMDLDGFESQVVGAPIQLPLCPFVERMDSADAGQAIRVGVDNFCDIVVLLADFVVGPSE